MVEYEELVSIGIIAVQAIIKNKTAEQLEKYNKAYVATAIRWAIRNELRSRHKWYALRHSKAQQTETVEPESEDAAPAKEKADSFEDDGGDAITPTKVREAVYEVILSIDSIAAQSSDNDSPFDFIRDNSAMPDERAELSELGRTIKEAVAQLPPKERTIVEYRFYRNMQIKEIAVKVGLSSSRITRVIQSSLNVIREYLIAHEHDGY